MQTRATDLVTSYEGEGSANFRGLTKREYFAAIALNGVESSNPMEEPLSIKEVAERAVKLADALIEALNKEYN